MERSLLLFLCMSLLLSATQSCRATYERWSRRYENLSRPMYEELKREEKKKESSCQNINIADHGALLDMSHQRLMAEIKKCDKANMDVKVGTAIASTTVSYLSGTLNFIGFKYSFLFPTALMALIPTNGCSKTEFTESIVDDKLLEDYLDQQKDLAKGWASTYDDILKVNDSNHRYSRLLALNDDMNSRRFRFLKDDEKIKMNSALIARNYLNARMQLMVEIIHSTVNSRDNAMHRRNALKLMNETVIYIKESVELVRRWRYLTSKDKSFFKERTHLCSFGLCTYAGESHWVYRFTYDEDTFDELFQNVACPIVELNKASLLLKKWKKTANLLIKYPEVCTPGKIDCDLILKELSHKFIISSGCIARYRVFEFEQPCLN